MVLKHGAALGFRLPPQEKWATLHMLLVAGAVELLVRLVPLPRASRALGISFDASTTVPEAKGAELLLTAVERRRLRCLSRLLRHWKLARGPCLRASMAGGYVLRKHDPRLMLGVSRSDGAVTAHAWLFVDGVHVGRLEYFDLLTSESNDDTVETRN